MLSTADRLKIGAALQLTGRWNGRRYGLPISVQYAPEMSPVLPYHFCVGAAAATHRIHGSAPNLVATIRQINELINEAIAKSSDLLRNPERDPDLDGIQEPNR